MSFQQLTFDQEYNGILPRQQSKPERHDDFNEFFDTFFKVKIETDFENFWNKIHEVTNWKDIFQELYKDKKHTKLIRVELPANDEPKDYCNTYVTKACFSTKKHQKGKVYMKHKKLKCFRPQCPIDWVHWVYREATRLDERIIRYVNIANDNNRLIKNQRGIGEFMYSKPIHVIVSPPKKDWFLSFEELKKEARKNLDNVCVIGGSMIFHAFRQDNDGNWFYSPHFHIIGFGWVKDTNKNYNKTGWVTKNKGLRDSVFSTACYLLSHCAVSEKLHAVTWFGELSYRSKYAVLLKPIEEEKEPDRCPVCSDYMVSASFSGLDRPPPTKECYGFVSPKVLHQDETVKEMLEEWERRKNPRPKEDRLHIQYFNKECLEAKQQADSFGKRVMNGFEN